MHKIPISISGFRGEGSAEGKGKKEVSEQSSPRKAKVFEVKAARKARGGTKEGKSKMEQQDTRNKLKSLSIVLLISVVCLIGITFYAGNWEYIAQISWKEKLQQTAQAIKERIAPGPEIIEIDYEAVDMSHSIPVFMTTLEEGDGMVNVPLLSQKECGYQTGCELVSGAMVLQYYGLEISPQDIYDVIPKTDVLMNADGTGADPRQVFIGDPKGMGGYGCYANPLIDAMNQLLNEEWHAVNISGTPLSELEEGYLKNGTPVIIWTTIHMMEPEQGNRWKLQDGTEFQWIAGEHCLVLVGADKDYYYFNDPNHADEVVGYERGTVEERYQQMGRQAIILSH